MSSSEKYDVRHSPRRLSQQNTRMLKQLAYILHEPTLLPDCTIGAQVGDYVTFDYVLRRSNGYFVYSTTGSGSGQQEPTKFARNYQEEPVTFRLGDGLLIAGAPRTSKP